jgi:tetratricopeptide (TPR) repeat protein
MDRWLPLAFALACACGAAHSQEDASAPDRDRQASFGALKFKALATEAGLGALLHQPPDRPNDDPRVYFGSSAASLKLLRITMTIDEGAPIERDLDETEAKALSDTGDLAWLESATLLTGPHRVHADVQARDDSKPDLGVQDFPVDAQVDLAQPDDALEFDLKGGNLFTAARLEAHERRTKAPERGWLTRTVDKLGGLARPDGSFVKGSTDDPRMRYVRLLTRLGRDDEAAAELIGLSQEPSGEALPDTFWLTLASTLRQADLPDQAAAICDRLDNNGAERQAVGVERLRLGDVQYHLGNTEEAEKELLSAQGRLPPDRVQDWQLAYAQLQFDRQQFADALRTLRNGNDETIDAYRYMDQSEEAVQTASFRRFNLAVAMIHEGDEAHGTSLLDLVGRLRSSDARLARLRDKANLTLGWHFLRKKQGGTAMGILARVSSRSPYANSALLGMGWAELAPGGKSFGRVRLESDPDDPLNPLPAPVRNSLIQLGALEPETRGGVGPGKLPWWRPAQTRDEGLHRALSYWEYLSGRNPRDPTVQESMLAIAYAFDSLGDLERARDAYSRAIALLEEQKRVNGDHQAELKAGGLPTGIDSVDDAAQLARVVDRLNLAPDDSSGALYNSIARYADLSRVRDRLRAIQNRLGTQGRESPIDVTSLLAELDTSLQTEGRILRTLAQRQLEQQRENIDGYLKMAYFAAARDSDNDHRVLE